MSIVTRLVTRLTGWTVRGLESRHEQDFFLVSQKFKLDVGPQPHSYSVGTKGYFSAVMSQESAAESSAQSSAVVLNEWSLHDVDKNNLTSVFPPKLIHSFYKSVRARVLVFKVTP